MVLQNLSSYLARRANDLLGTSWTRRFHALGFFDKRYERTFLSSHFVFESSSSHFDAYTAAWRAFRPLVPFGCFANCSFVPGKGNLIWIIEILFFSSKKKKLYNNYRLIASAYKATVKLTGIQLYQRHTSLSRLIVYYIPTFSPFPS